MKITNKYARIVKEAGLCNTLPRAAIYEFLCNNPIHPTAETVYQEMLKLYPGMSRTTAYNVLHSLSNKGLIQTIVLEECEMRFDADISFHAHFKCKKCGGVFDFPAKPNPRKFSDLPKDFKVEETHLYYKGTCPSCK